MARPPRGEVPVERERLVHVPLRHQRALAALAARAAPAARDGAKALAEPGGVERREAGQRGQVGRARRAAADRRRLRPGQRAYRGGELAIGRASTGRAANLPLVAGGAGATDG